jgi:hypothetical protein
LLATFLRSELIANWSDVKLDVSLAAATERYGTNLFTLGKSDFFLKETKAAIGNALVNR